MKIIVLEKELPGKSAGEFKPFLTEEAEKEYELYTNNIIREIYFRDDESTAVIILECSYVDEAGEILDEMPLVKNGLIKFEFIPLRAYSAFERLFADNQ